MVNRTRRWSWLPALAGGLLVGLPATGTAQVPVREGLITVDGIRLDFARTGGWRVRARAVAGRRLLARGAGRVHAEPRTGPAAMVLAGTFYLPSVLLEYPDADPTSILPVAAYDSLFHGSVAPGGRPYTLRGLYDEMSAGLLDLQGAVYDWTRTDSTLAYLIAPCPASGGLCGAALRRLTDAFRGALTTLDPAVDFSQFDNDGPDGRPNSGDDDGIVDIIQFTQPAIGAECGGPGFWAHKSTFANNDPFRGAFVTNDSTPGGAAIRIDSYFIAAGVGGIDCDDPQQLMGIGLSAHELGHGLDLPDLYDTGGSSNAVGEWGLMGSAMYTTLGSPGHFSAWTKERLGWVSVVEVGAPGAYTLGPTLIGDTVLLIRPSVPNPRGEYFLLENKQPVQADTANLQTGGQTGPKRGGLLVWHIDSLAVAQRSAGNTVNTGSLHGVRVVQADGLAELQQFITTGDRGDAGDPFPGDSNRTRFSQTTSPAALLNFDGSCVGFRLDSIAVNGSPGVVSFQLEAEVPFVVRASDTTALVMVNGDRHARFAECVNPVDTFVVEIDSIQQTADGRSEFGFVAWSDGGARVHPIVGPVPGDSVVATVSERHRVLAQVTGPGVVTAISGDDVTSGAFFDAQTQVTLVAAAGDGAVLDGWSGDTMAAGDTLILSVTRPVDVVATFAPILSFVDTLPPAPVVGAPYTHALSASGGGAVRSFAVTAGRLPTGLTLDARGVVSGIPSAPGAFAAVVDVQSGSQQVTRTVQWDVTAPVVAVDDVVSELLGLGTPLSTDEIRYLDLTGNANGRFDVGDFLAWVDRLEPAAAARVRRAWRER